MARIDLRSDTVTQPTPEMRRAMAEAEVGDDVYGEDPTVHRLEEEAADRLGKEAALFVPSGTMGNQIAVLSHTERGDEVIVEAESHIYWYEVGAIAALSSAQPRTVVGRRGVFGPEELRAALRPANIHYPPTRLVCIENTHNRAGGTVWTEDETERLARAAHEEGLRVHLDGARIFNAAVALGTTAARLAAPADSVMFCLSKGLAAPVGSLVCGTREFIARARRYRKMLGGGMRQAGVLAAAGLVALRTMVDRLAEDHENARRLAEGLAAIPGFSVDLETVVTNMVAVDVAGTGVPAEELVRRMAEEGVLANATGPYRIRFVTHKDVARSDIPKALRAIERSLGRVALGR
ncbi:MAG: low-specificity L-threonine aldolase [Clostridia bacterium]|nr:low-specificity L-threonine aldolase [Clostridia bacterium]